MSVVLYFLYLQLVVSLSATLKVPFYIYPRVVTLTAKQDTCTVKLYSCIRNGRTTNQRTFKNILYVLEDFLSDL